MFSHLCSDFSRPGHHGDPETAAAPIERATPVTQDVREFSRVDGLSLEDRAVWIPVRLPVGSRIGAPQAGPGFQRLKRASDANML